MPHRTITIIGPIASGKTTASQMLSQALKLPLMDADPFEENPFLPSYVKDTPRWAFATELFFTIQRIKKLQNLPALLKESDVIVDSGLIMSHHVYAKNHLVQGTMTAAEWDFFSRIIEDYENHVPSPDIVIHLQAPPKLQLKRIRQRGRSFEADYKLLYLEQITDRLDDYALHIQGVKEVAYIPFSTEKYDIVTDGGAQHFLQKIKQAL